MSETYNDTIMVVDDNPNNLRFLSSILRDYGYRVRSAISGEAALDSTQTSLPDLILMDLKMPGIDGYETTRRLKADERTRNIPVIVVSALNEAVDKIKAFKIGAVDYITKPIEQEELIARVHTHLTLSKLQARLESEVRKRTEDLEYQYLFMKTAFNALPDIIIVNDGKHLIYANPVFFDFMSEYDSLDAFRKEHDCFCDFFEKVDEQGYIYNGIEGKYWLDYMNEHPGKTFRVMIKRGEQTHRFLLTYDHLHFKEELRNICTFTDITELELYRNNMETQVQERTRELEDANKKLQELDRLKSMFIASMSHELRTPLNSIIGFTDIVKNEQIGSLNNKQKDFLERVHGSGKNLLGIIQDIIDISKIEAGIIDVSIEAVEINELINKTIDELSVLSHKKGIALDNTSNKKTEVYTDAKRLKQCLTNLIGNAVKFSEKGTVTISVNMDEGRVCIAVKDEGIGISQDDMDKLFAPFQRIESHISVQAGGTGLGLYLTKKIVDTLLYGYMNVKSEIGKGSEFTICIPVVYEENSG